MLDLDGTLVDTHGAMRMVVLQTLEQLVGELPESVRGAIADRWIEDQSRYFHRYQRLPVVVSVDLAGWVRSGWTEPVMETAVGYRSACAVSRR